MSNTIKSAPLEVILTEFSGLGLSSHSVEFLRQQLSATSRTVTQNGEILAQAPIKGRTEGLGVTVAGLSNTGDINAATKVVGRSEGLGTTTGNLDATGKLTSTDAIAADGTGSPLTGGKRGFNALDVNSRLADSFKANPVNVTNVSTSASTLSNDGVSHSIAVAASSVQFGAGLLSYNSGSVDPGAFGTFYVYASDPTFSGGAVTYLAATAPQTTASGDGLIYFGKIITVGGISKTGGGNSGGTTPGGNGGNRGL